MVLYTIKKFLLIKDILKILTSSGIKNIKTRKDSVLEKQQ